MTFPIIPASTVNGSYQISRSLRFRSSASAYLSRTPASAGNQNTFTWSGWVKRGVLGAWQDIFEAYNSAATYADLQFTANNTLIWYNQTAATQTLNLETTPVFRDASAWYHIVVSYDSPQATASNRAKVYVNGVQITSFSTATYPAQNTNNTINSAVSHFIGKYGGNANYLDGYLAEVNFIDGQALTPSSFGAFDGNGVWQPAKYTGSYGTNGFYLPFNNLNSTSQNLLTYSEQFDNAAWQKPAAPVAPTITANSTTAPNGTTTADTINYSGVTTHPCYQETSVSVANGSTITTSMYVKASSGASFLLQCALMSPTAQDNYAVITFTGGVATTTPYAANLTTTVVDVGNGWYRVTATATNQTGVTATVCRISIGQNSLSGVSSIYVWGAQMNYGSAYSPYINTVATAQTTATTNLGADYQIAGGGWNNWVSNNISLTSGTTYDSMIDSPTNYADGGNGRGNYPVFNPLFTDSVVAANTGRYYADGNLKFGVTSGNQCHARTTMAFAPGSKWYFEATLGQLGGAADMVGIVKDADSWTVAAADYYSYGANGTFYGTGMTGSGASYVAGDIIGVAIDRVANTVAFYKNNALQGSFSINSTTSYVCYFYLNLGSGSGSWIANFGQRPFTYTPPSGFSALNTQNLPTPTIANGAQYMAAITFTTNSGSSSVTTANFQPDFVWIKDRQNAIDHYLHDVVRTAGKYLSSNTTGAEGTGGGVTSFNSNGFSYTIGNTASWMSWMWKAGGTGVTNTSGSITSTVSANTSAGFSVVTYTGTGANATVGHGLGVTPSMIITKRRTTFTSGWGVWHTALAATEYLLLNTTDAKATAATAWNSTLPTSTVFSVGNASFSNGSVDGYVAYCFAPVAGYSAFGSYTGNGSTDGPFVYTGFRPRFVLIKRITGAIQNWVIEDSSRDTYNVDTKYLLTDSSAAEGSDTLRDLLSNGFKIRSANQNNNGDTFIYAAFAENPFKYSRAR